MTAIALPGWVVMPAAIAFFLALWIFGEGALLWVGGRFLAKAPKATFWRSVGTNVLAALAASVCAGLLYGFFAPAPMPFGPVMHLPWFLLGVAAGLIVTWLVIMGMFRVSFGKAILAWLPTLGQSVPTVLLLIAILLPPLNDFRDVAKARKCRANVWSIATGISAYVEDPAGTQAFPPDLNALVVRNLFPEEGLHCPAAKGDRKCDYFYVPPAGKPTYKQILLCDYRGNHADWRHVVYGDLRVAYLTEKQFQDELTDADNAAFAQALRAAEGP